MADDRFENLANWHTLDIVRRFACARQDVPGWQCADMRAVLAGAVVSEQPMPDDLFGVIAGERGAYAQRWVISINDRLPLAAANATLGHELGHTFQAEGLRRAFCAPRAGLPLVEREAHAYGALLTVPPRAVNSLTLGDYRAMRQVAVELTVPVSYVQIRTALAVLFGERRGGSANASAHLGWAFVAHQQWMARIADLMSARG